MADLSSILGGMVQGFKDFGTGLVDFFGTGAANIGDIASSIATGRATTKNQDDFRKWLYQTDDKQDAAAKGLGTILNGVSTVADVMPGAQAVTANPLFNGLQGAIGGVSDELKMAGKDADWGRAAQRAGVGAASGLASGYAGQGLAKTGNKLLSNGLTRGAVSGALGGGIANAGYTGIEGGSVQDMINAGLYGAQTGALVGGTTGLARELIKPTHKMDAALTDDEKAARIANIDDQLGKLDTTTPEGNARYAELTAARENYEPKTYYHGSPETDITEFDINRAGKNTRSGEKAIYFTDTPEAAEEFAYERIPTDSIFVDKTGKRGGVYEANLDMRNTLDLDNLTDAQIRELWNYASPLGQLDGQEAFVQRLTDWRDKYHNPQLTKGYIDLEALRNSPYDSFSATMYPNTDNKAREYAIFDASKAKITKSPKTVADLMAESKPKTIYHGTNAVFEDFDERLPSVWFTDNADDIANTGLSNKGGKINIMERELPNNLKLADWDLADRLTKQQLIDRGYDGIAYTESGTSGKDTYYEIFKPNKTLKKIGKAPKTVADLMNEPTTDVDIRYAKTTPGDGQMSLFDQELNVAESKNNRYEPTGNTLTPAMRKRADEIINDYLTEKKVPDNELFDKIDPSTLPNKHYETGKMLDRAYSMDVNPREVLNMAADQVFTKQLGEKPSKQKLIDYLYGAAEDEDMRKTMVSNDIGIYTEPDALSENSLSKIAKARIRDSIAGEGVNAIAAGNRTVRQGYTGSLDTILSERLGIAPGNTYKKNGAYDVPNSAGRHESSPSRPGINNIMVAETPNVEKAVSTVGHERLHSFQAESRTPNRYSQEVNDAYNELAKDLKAAKAYRTGQEIKDWWGENVSYFRNHDEQEARMFQQYLEKKGYTEKGPKQSNKVYHDINSREFDDSKIMPAFDKFIDKLRDLSKRGIALPAITALFGGGAIMAATQGDDKKKKSEVK